MIPLSDDNPTLRTPVMTYLILGGIIGTWVLVQGAGFNPYRLAQTICDLGLVAGEITHKAPVGEAVPLGPGLACVVDNDPINSWTLLTHMFLHGGWGHLLGNCLFFWVFGNNIEDSLGRFRFVVFYLLCGLAAAGAQIAINPASAIPMVGASGAISGILGAYLVLYPRVRVNMLFFFFVFIRVIPVPAWLVLLWWFGWQVIAGLPALSSVSPEVSEGVAVWAHIGGFITGVLLVKLFQNHEIVDQRTALRHERHPDRYG
jgi:membrane associated rhomboid family serine protease